MIRMLLRSNLDRGPAECDDTRHRHATGMREAEFPTIDPPRAGDLQGSAVQVEHRLPRRRPVDLDLGPVDAVSQSGAESLQYRLLGGEAGGVPLAPHRLRSLCVVTLAPGETAGDEPLAMLPEHPFDAIDLDEIDAVADDAGGRRRHVRTVPCRSEHMSVPAHQPHTAGATPPRLALVTVSDTRDRENDPAGDLASRIAEDAGIQVVIRQAVPDDPDTLGPLLDAIAANATVDAIICLGGTGIGPRDRTPDVVQARLRMELPGFGEHVRALGIRDVGPASILSRALAGIASASTGHEVLIFTLPGSLKATDTVMREIIAPLLPHAIWELRGRPAAD